MFGIPEQHIDQLVKKDYPGVEGTIEECAELIQALSKPYPYEKRQDKLREEMAHVLVSMNVLARTYDISMDDIKREVVIKAIKDDFDTSDYIFN